MNLKSRPFDDFSIAGISKPLSQAESKRLSQVMPVLEFILENSIFSARQLMKSTKVSRDSIDRTIKMLEHEKIINLKETKARGEKFYELKSESKLKSFYENSREWWAVKILFKNKVQKGAKKLKKTMILNTKKAMHSSRILSELDKKKHLKFASKARQQQITKIPYPQPVIIWEMPMSEASKLVKNFESGLLCETCFQENKISYLVIDSDEEVCEAGHAIVLQSTEEYSPHSEPLTRKRSKSISDSELKFQRKELLGKPRKSRADDE